MRSAFEALFSSAVPQNFLKNLIFTDFQPSFSKGDRRDQSFSLSPSTPLLLGKTVALLEGAGKTMLPDGIQVNVCGMFLSMLQVFAITQQNVICCKRLL